MTDGAAAVGILIPNISVPIGESALREVKIGDETTSGRTNSIGAPKTCIIKEPGELMALKASESAEELILRKLRLENPTLKPVKHHILVARHGVSVSVASLLPARTPVTGVVL